jgi:hypothetical protein
MEEFEECCGHDLSERGRPPPSNLHLPSFLPATWITSTHAHLLPVAQAFLSKNALDAFLTN